VLGGLFTRSAQAKATVALKELKLGCQKLLSEAGTSNGEAVAAEVIRLWGELDDAARISFFEYLDALAPEEEHGEQRTLCRGVIARNHPRATEGGLSPATRAPAAS
jgi:hypothetical protein